MALTAPSAHPPARASAGLSSPDPMWLADSVSTPMPSAWRPSIARPPVLLAPPKLLGKLGEAFAASLTDLQERLRSGDPQEFESALEALDRLENLGLQVQQMARVMAHDGAQASESVDLGEALSRAFAQWSNAAAASGFAFSRPDATSARVLVDPALLEQLLDLAIELAFESGDSLAARVRTQPASRQAVLLIDVQRSGAITAAAAEGDVADEGADDLRWLMLTQVARAGGIASRREVSGSMLSFVLTFPLAAVGGLLVGGADQAMGSSV